MAVCRSNSNRLGLRTTRRPPSWQRCFRRKARAVATAALQNRGSMANRHRDRQAGSVQATCRDSEALKERRPSFDTGSRPDQRQACFRAYRATLRLRRRINNITSAMPAAIHMTACMIVLFICTVSFNRLRILCPKCCSMGNPRFESEGHSAPCNANGPSREFDGTARPTNGIPYGFCGASSTSPALHRRRSRSLPASSCYSSFASPFFEISAHHRNSS